MTAARRQWTAVATIIVAVALTTMLALRLHPAARTAEPGDIAPEFAAADIASGQSVPLATYHGRVVLLNIWATWCTPCRVEMPSLESLHRRFAATDLRVVAVSVDRGDPTTVRDYVRNMGLSFDVLHDRTGEIEQIYQTVGLPETFLIDRDGVIVKKVVGAAEWDTPAMQTLVRRLLDGE